MPPRTQHPAPTATPERRLALRLGLAGAAAFLVAIPFTLLVLLVTAESEELERVDRAVGQAVLDTVEGRPWLRETALVVSELTQPWRPYLVAFVAAVVLWVRRHRRLAIWLVATIVIGWSLGGILKLIVERARPQFPETVYAASGYSFPSGHALNSMLLAACVVVLLHPWTRGVRRVLLWLAAITYAVVVGLDRMVLGVHYLSDVLAGWIVALAVVTATVAAFQTWRRAEHLPPASVSEGLAPEEGPP